MMRIQIQLLSNTLHRQLFMVYLQNYEMGRSFIGPCPISLYVEGSGMCGNEEDFCQGVNGYLPAVPAANARGCGSCAPVQEIYRERMLVR